MATMGDLDQGENSGAIISLKVVTHLPKDNDVPISYLVVDHKYNFSVVSVYNANKELTDAIRFGDSILIKNPNVIFTKLEYKGKLYSYQSIKVTEINNILVNRHALTSKYASSELISDTFIRTQKEQTNSSQ
jgi:hypothetical protein